MAQTPVTKTLTDLPVYSSGGYSGHVLYTDSNIEYRFPLNQIALKADLAQNSGAAGIGTTTGETVQTILSRVTGSVFYSKLNPASDADQTALMQAEVNSLVSGMTYITPPGTIRITTVVFPVLANMHIQLSGTIFKLPDGATPLDSDMIRFNTITDSVIDGLYVDGNRANITDTSGSSPWYGRVIGWRVGNNSARCVFRNLTMVNMLYCGSQWGRNINDIIIENWYADNIGEHAFYISGNGGGLVNRVKWINGMVGSIGVNANNATASHACGIIKSAQTVGNNDYFEIDGLDFYQTTTPGYTVVIAINGYLEHLKLRNIKIGANVGGVLSPLGDCQYVEIDGLEGVKTVTTLTTTATGASGASSVTVSSATGLTVGNFISFAGISDVFMITSISGTTVGIDHPLISALTSAIISTVSFAGAPLVFSYPSTAITAYKWTARRVNMPGAYVQQNAQLIDVWEDCWLSRITTSADQSTSSFAPGKELKFVRCRFSSPAAASLCQYVARNIYFEGCVFNSPLTGSVAAVDYIGQNQFATGAKVSFRNCRFKHAGNYSIGCYNDATVLEVLDCTDGLQQIYCRNSTQLAKLKMNNVEFTVGGNPPVVASKILVKGLTNVLDSAGARDYSSYRGRWTINTGATTIGYDLSSVLIGAVDTKNVQITPASSLAGATKFWATVTGNSVYVNVDAAVTGATLFNIQVLAGTLES